MAGNRDFLYAALGAYDLTITTSEQVISSPSREHTHARRRRLV